jgi:hypothetical protein
MFICCGNGKKLGLRSSFNFVAEDYPRDINLFASLRENGFEIGLHGLNHKGNLFQSKKTFFHQAPLINQYLKDWKISGFRTPCMYHNLEWIGFLDINYDMSTFDTDPFEPQPDGVGTIFPFWYQSNGYKGYVEIPYTLPQDFTLFILLGEKSINIWKKKLDWIAEEGGMVLLITHPDYINFDSGRRVRNQYPMDFYREFLEYITHQYNEQYWNCLPGELADYWKEKIIGREKEKVQ